MKHQALFSLNDKSEKVKCRLQPFLPGALRIKLSASTETFPDVASIFTPDNQFHAEPPLRKEFSVLIFGFA